MQSVLRSMDVGSSFELVAARGERGRRVPIAGVMLAQPITHEGLETLELPPCAQRREVQALRARGDSLVDDGIFDGDRILIEPSIPVREGQTVVAEIDGQIIVKRWYPERNGSVRLQPANDRVLPLVVRSERVRVLGVLVGVLRKCGFARGRDAAASPPPSRRSERDRRADGRTLDLALRIVQHNLAEWQRLVAAHARASGQRTRMEANALTQSLRALHATYAATESPRLRRALLDEAGRISRRMRAVAAALGWSATEIRPLTL